MSSFRPPSDCGGTWSRAVKLNDTNKVNQGASIAIDPATGVVYVVWRRLASGSQTDAIMMTRSFRGRLFSTPSVVASLPAYSDKNPTAPSFFDQGTTGNSFRTTAYPMIGIDRRPDAGSEDDDEPDTPAFRGKVFVAWSQRGIGPSGDARVVLSSSTDGASTWSTPTPIDSSALSDDSGHLVSRGHQFMPQMTVTADKITVIYYDARFDHTLRSLLAPWLIHSFLPDPVTGKFYLETRSLRGELLDPGGAARVFTPFFVETGMTEWRHTLDLRVCRRPTPPSPPLHVVTPFAVHLRHARRRDRASSPPSNSSRSTRPTSDSSSRARSRSWATTSTSPVRRSSLPARRAAVALQQPARHQSRVSRLLDVEPGRAPAGRRQLVELHAAHDDQRREHFDGSPLPPAGPATRACETRTSTPPGSRRVSPSPRPRTPNRYRPCSSAT